LVTASGIHRVNSKAGVIEEVYPSKYWPGHTLGDHLEFALKYDGTNLAILSILFRKIAQKDLLIHVQSKPTGKYARRLWFLYEFLTGKMLPLEDLKRGNYIDLLELIEVQNRIVDARFRDFDYRIRMDRDLIIDRQRA
jgi:hypothetical protein